MSGQLTTYRNEIFNFLRTVTIKFEPFAWLMGETYMDQYGITNPHGKWNPYYIHLSGNYTPEELSNPDKLIHISSLVKILSILIHALLHYIEYPIKNISLLKKDILNMWVSYEL